MDIIPNPGGARELPPTAEERARARAAVHGPCGCGAGAGELCRTVRTGRIRLIVHTGRPELGQENER